MTTIKDLEIGQIVEGDYGYAKVTLCIHGNIYLALVGTKLDGEEGILRQEDITEQDIVTVIDDDVLCIKCCG